jgi:hypothetical protein
MEAHREFWALLRQRKGGEIRADTEPTDDQIAALKVRVVDLGLSPYADFGLFTNFQLRFLKSLKFTNHVLQADGTWRTVEVPGPPDWDSWYSSWRVFENVMLGLTMERPNVGSPGTSKHRIMSQSTLDTYRDSFRDLVKAYPEVWHLCVVAEDRCRAEHVARLKRKAEDDHILGLMPRFDPNCPWDTVLRLAAQDRGYWDECVREPALKFIASGSKRAGQPTGSLTGEIRTNEGGPPRKKTKREKSRGVGGGRPSAPPPPNNSHGSYRKGKKGNQGKGNKGGGKLSSTREGNPICYSWNNGGCDQVCSKGFAHVCQVCLGGHRALDHPRGGKGRK